MPFSNFNVTSDFKLILEDCYENTDNLAREDQLKYLSSPGFGNFVMSVDTTAVKNLGTGRVGRAGGGKYPERDIPAAPPLHNARSRLDGCVFWSSTTPATADHILSSEEEDIMSSVHAALQNCRVTL